MPLGLRLLCLCFLGLGGLALLVGVVPFDHYPSSGRISFGQWWLQGYGLLFLAKAAFLNLLAAYGLVRRTIWSRPLCFVPWSISVFTARKFPDGGDLAAWAIFMLLLGLYLYRSSSVIAYFASAPSPRNA